MPPAPAALDPPPEGEPALLAGGWAGGSLEQPASEPKADVSRANARIVGAIAPEFPPEPF